MGALKRIGLVAVLVGMMGTGCCSKEQVPSEFQKDGEVSARIDDSGFIVVKDLFSSVEECDIHHRGAFLDLGTPSVGGRVGFNLYPGQDGQDILRDGSTWLRVESGSLSLSFHQLSEEPVFVQARIRGLGARAATIRIDGKLVGTVRFRRDKVEVISTGLTTDVLSVGRHILSLQFHRKKRDEASAEVDWVRVGTADNDSTTYGPPTFRDLATEGTIADQPYRTLAMRGPGSVRCALSVSEDMRFQTMLGYVGQGEGEARIQLVEPGKPSQLLHATKLGGEGKEAEPVDLPLEGLAGRIVVLELIATATSPGGKILFGEPAIRVRDPRLSSRPEAKVVVLVVLTGADASYFPGYGDVSTMPVMSSLVEESVVFLEHRAPTTVSTGSMASLLTGLSPATHRITDTGARLGQRVSTVGTVARDGRVVTGMFTGNPTSFEAFGFDRGWDRYAMFSPVSGTSAGAPLREATSWLEERLEKDAQRPLLTVVHARAGHPPWSATAEEAKELEPKDYSGNLNSRRGGQILAKERNRRFGRRTMTAEDRVRARAFANLALGAEDALLGQLVDALRHQKVWDSTMLMITSDVAMGGSTRIPFGDGEALGEDVLRIPLVIRFPEGRFRGTRVQVSTTPMDVARTVLLAMGLEAPETMRGRDLLEVSAYPGRFGAEPQVALVEGNYATRWGDWLLAGKSPKTPIFCKFVQGSMGCTEDEGEEHSLLFSWAWRSTFDHLRQSETLMNPSLPREPAILDPETVAALTVWGNLEPIPEKKK